MELIMISEITFPSQEMWTNSAPIDGRFILNPEKRKRRKVLKQPLTFAEVPAVAGQGDCAVFTGGSVNPL